MAKSSERFDPSEIAKLLLKISADTDEAKDAIKDLKKDMSGFTKDIEDEGKKVGKELERQDKGWKKFSDSITDSLSGVLGVTQKLSLGFVSFGAILQGPAFIGFREFAKHSLDVKVTFAKMNIEFDRMKETLARELWPLFKEGITFITNLAGAFNDLSKEDKALIGWFMRTTGIVSLVAAAFLALSPVLQLILSIGLLPVALAATAVYLAFTHWDKIKGWVEGISTAVKGLVDRVVQLVKELLGLNKLYMGVGGLQLGVGGGVSTGGKIGQFFRELLKGFSGGILGEPGAKQIHGGFPWDIRDEDTFVGPPAPVKKGKLGTEDAIGRFETPSIGGAGGAGAGGGGVFSFLIGALESLEETLSVIYEGQGERVRETKLYLGKVVENLGIFQKLYDMATQVPGVMGRYADLVGDRQAGIKKPFEVSEAPFESFVVGFGTGIEERSLKNRSERGRDFMDKLGKGARQSMEWGISAGLVDGLETGFRRGRQIIERMGQAMIRVVTDRLAENIVDSMYSAFAGSKGGGGGITDLFFKGIAAIGSFGAPDSGGLEAMRDPNFYEHAGGVLARAHQGLALDESMFIGQAGEGVLSRRGMDSLARSNLSSLNAGGGTEGGQSVTYVIVATDAKSFSQLVENDKAHIHQLVGDAVIRNKELRRILRENL